MKTSRRRLAWLLFYLLLLTGMFYCAYRWSMEAAPLKGYIGFWPEEWTTSGQAWAKDRFGPVVLFWGGLDNPGWSLSEESNSQLRTFWKECETFWRLTFFCWSMWACGLAGLFGGAKCRESVYGDNEGKKRQTIRRKRNAALVASLSSLLFFTLYYWAANVATHTASPSRDCALAFYRLHPKQDTIYKELLNSWDPEWDQSGLKWARDHYGPVLLQEGYYLRTGPHSWWQTGEIYEGRRESCRWSWRQREVAYRFTAIIIVLWLYGVGLLVALCRCSAPSSSTGWPNTRSGGYISSGWFTFIIRFSCNAPPTVTATITPLYPYALGRPGRGGSGNGYNWPTE